MITSEFCLVSDMKEMHLLKLICLVNLVILCTPTDGQRTCSDEQRIGLLELKSFVKTEVMHGAEHVVLPSWIDDPRSDCCGWERVSCNPTTGRIDRLSLFNIRQSNLHYFYCFDSPNWNISLLQTFKDLKTLILAYNCIRWKENQGLLKLQQLETLDLSYNSLTSSHLHSLRKLRSLKNLNLSGNSFNGSFPAREVSAFENLETLDLSWNTLQDSPTKFDSADFSKLRNVILHDNSFNSTNIMRFLGSLPSLKSLDLSSNGMRGTLSNQDLIKLGRLEILDLRSNFMEGSIPRTIGKLSYLKALYLAENGFRGSLPVPGLCELRRLQVLDIRRNSFEGTLPPCLSNLTSLKILDLHHNFFSGPVAPFSIPSQKFLQFMDISNNDFEGLFSFSSIFNHSRLEVLVLGSTENKLEIDNGDQAGVPLFQLKALRLSNCHMKNAPLFLLNQHSLIWVDISHNMLSGALPFWLLANNTDLKFLNLGNNSFTGELDPLPKNPMNGLVYMDLSYNHIGGHLPKDLGLFLPNLQHLNLSYNSFEGELPASVGAMGKLLLLDLSFNSFSGEVPKELVENCTDLVGLMLNNNNFHGDFFSTQFNLSRVRVLRLGDNEFNGSLAENEFYSDMLVFDVSNNNMTGEIPNGIDASVLLLQNNSFEGQIPCEGFHEAQVIDISHNFLSGPIPSCLIENFDGYSPVFLLNLEHNRLSGNIPPQLGSLLSIKILLLGNNLFDGSVPKQLCQVTEIRIMDLSNNSISGSIPSCLSNVPFGNDSNDSIGELTFPYGHMDFVNLLQELYDFSSFWDSDELVAKYVCKIDFVTKNSLLSYQGNGLNNMSGLDLSCNNLTGAVPQSLGKLSSLHALNLSHNHLTGHIPVSFSNLHQIESLDFSYNNLSGKIPSELVDLNFLAAFSVAHNNLSGRVPDKGQLGTFGIGSYEGNPFLSGLPSDKNHTKVIDRPLPSDGTKEKWYEVDRNSFFASFVTSYCVVLLTLGGVLYINPNWRRRWFNFIENSIYSCYYFVVIDLRRLTRMFFHV